VQIISSSFLKFGFWLSTTVPDKSIPGICGNSLTSLAPFFKTSASL
jgi:hypothetical protein